MRLKGHEPTISARPIVFFLSLMHTSIQGVQGPGRAGKHVFHTKSDQSIKERSSVNQPGR